MAKVIGLFIGVNRYRADSGLADLRYCANDAAAVRQLFESASNVETRAFEADYVDGQEVLKWLTLLADAGLSSEDTILVFFSGNGYTRDGRDFLAFSTTLPTDESSALALPDLMGSLRQSGAGKFFVILDCCRFVRPNMKVIPFRTSASSLDSSYDAMIFTGCSLGEFSQEHESLGRKGLGVFTAALCSVIEGYERIPLYLLEREVKRESARICGLHNLQLQRPQLLGSRSLASYDLLKLEHVNLEGMRRRIVIVSGPTESGKTSIGQLIQDNLGLTHIEMSRFVRKSYGDYVRSTGKNISLPEFVEEVLWSGGNVDVVAKHALKELQTVAGDVIVTGPRRPEEIAAILGADADCLLIYLDAKASTRWSRLVMDSNDAAKEDFEVRNLREARWGLAETAHFEGTEVVRNEGSIGRSLTEIASLWRRRFGIH